MLSPFFPKDFVGQHKETSLSLEGGVPKLVRDGPENAPKNVQEMHTSGFLKKLLRLAPMTR